jgi:hypothetical protein
VRWAIGLFRGARLGCRAQMACPPLFLQGILAIKLFCKGSRYRCFEGPLAVRCDQVTPIPVYPHPTPPPSCSDPSTINTRCALHPGQLGVKPGEKVSLDCKPGLMAGSFVTIQIRYILCS